MGQPERGERLGGGQAEPADARPGELTPTWKFEPRKVVRQREKEALRAEGRQAYKDGKSRQSNPRKYMDAMQWDRGYMEADAEANVGTDE